VGSVRGCVIWNISGQLKVILGASLWAVSEDMLCETSVANLKLF